MFTPLRSQETDAARLASNCEQAIYALLSGNASVLLASEFIRTWQDAVWAVATCAREARGARLLAEQAKAQVDNTR